MTILAINPGSTSTKIAIFEELQETFSRNIPHTPEQLHEHPTLTDQLSFRLNIIRSTLHDAGIAIQFDAVIGRGGLSHPVKAGCYDVTQQMMDDSISCSHQHACDLGCILAWEIARESNGCRAFVADPGTVDELCEEARISGSPWMNRIAIWHALNQRAMARRYAREHNTRYEDLNLIICHLGGGISIAAHDHGKAIDANNALDGEGPFSPDRAGSLPTSNLIHTCFSGKYTEEQMLQFVAGKGGLTAHLGTNDMREIQQRIENGDKKAEKVVSAMIYHVAKNIVAEAAVLYGQVDAIILTGGLAHSKYVTERLCRRIEWLSPVTIYPGENEMLAMAENALNRLKE